MSLIPASFLNQYMRAGEFMSDSTNMKSAEMPLKIEIAYQYWANDRINIRTATATGNKFDVSANTVINWMRKYHWQDRLKDETKEINENIRRESLERIEAGIKFYIHVVDDIVATFRSRVLTGEVSLTPDQVLKFMELGARMQGGEFGAMGSSDATGSSDTNKSLNTLITQIGKVMVDEHKE